MKKFSEKNLQKTANSKGILEIGDLVHICVNNGDYGYGIVSGEYNSSDGEFYYLVWSPHDNRSERFFDHELTYVS